MTQSRPDSANGEPTDSDWKAVEDSGAGSVPPLPQGVKFGGLALLAVLVIGAILLGIGLGGGFAGGPAASPTPELKMEPPVQLGSYVRGALNTSDDGNLVSADYTDGTASIVLLMQWPQDDLSAFMSDAGFDGAPSPSATGQPSESAPTVIIGSALCGYSDEFSTDETIGCGTIVRDTGLMVVGLSEQAVEEIRDLLDDFGQAVTG